MLRFMPLKPGKPQSRKPMARGKPLQSKGGMKAGAGFKTRPLSAIEQRQAQKKALQKATLRALEKARQEAEAQGIALSEWESDFIEGVAERVKTYGRAFADPDKGAPGHTLSARQGVKLNEIRKKAKKHGKKHDG